MLGKKILAIFLAAGVLIKLLALVTSPDKWLGLTEVMLGHPAIVTGVYLVLIAISGYYVFTSLDLIDVAVVMLFTSLLVGLSLMPYSAALLKLRGEFVTIGLGKAWPAVVMWGAVAVAIFYRVVASKK
jgi:hypothetical protein